LRDATAKPLIAGLVGKADRLVARHSLPVREFAREEAACETAQPTARAGKAPSPQMGSQQFEDPAFHA
jgi:hypothetical protein